MKIKKIEKLEVATPSAHAASVTYVKGDPVYAWFGGSYEGAPDVKIYLQHKEASSVFSIKVPTCPAKGTLPSWNPVLYYKNGELILFFKIGTFCDNWHTFMVKLTLTAKGFTATELFSLPAGFNGPVKTAPVFKDSVLYCGSSVETAIRWTSYIEAFNVNENMQVLDIRRSNPISTTCHIKGLIQPALWLDPKTDRMNAIMRSSRESDYLWWAQSAPANYLDWCAPVSLDIKNPNSGVAVVHHSNGKLYLVYNPCSTARTPLSIAELTIDPRTQYPSAQSVHTIDKIDPFDKHNGTPEVSYPYAVEAPDGTITVVYTYRRKYIKVAHIEI